MSDKTMLYEGKAKILYKGPRPRTIIQYFKDDATAFNAQKKGTLSGKGVINNHMSEYLMLGLERVNIPTHFIERTSMREQLVKEVEIIPVEIIVRNVAAGSICKRLGLEEGTPLDNTLVEYCYKSDEHGDPVVAAEHVFTLGWADPEELDAMTEMAYRVNDYLSGLFAGVGIHLIDFKLEFGRYFSDDDSYQVILADEISPDGCRLWDIKTGEKLDKDRFRRDLGGEIDAYRDVAARLGILTDQDVTTIADDH